MNLLKSIVAGTLLLTVFAALGGTALADSGKGKGGNGGMNEPSVMIGALGKTLVRGAVVTDVSGSTITAKTTLNHVDVSWTVHTDGGTEFLGAKKGNASLSDIAKDDLISFSGTLTGSLVVDAAIVREWTNASHEKKTGFSGVVSALSGSGFTLVHDKNGTKNIAVTVASSTTVTINGVSKSFADVKNDDRVKVTGTLSSDGNTVAASAILVGAVKNGKGGDDHLWKPILEFFKKFKDRS